MMMCDYPEKFDHNMLLEFQADEINETKDRIKVLMEDHLREGLKKAVARSNSVDSKSSSPNGKRNSIDSKQDPRKSSVTSKVSKKNNQV